MKSSHNILFFLIMLISVAAAAGIGYLYGRGGGPEGEGEAEEKAAEAIAKVKVESLRQTKLDRTVTAYGSVVPIAGEVRTLSIPFESIIRQVSIVVGQRVEGGTVLVVADPSPEALLQLDEVRATRLSAEKNLIQAKTRFEMKLLTNQELLLAQDALRMATLKLESLEKRGIHRTEIKTEKPVLIAKLNVQEGQIVAAASPLVSLIPGNGLEVELGVEPTEAGRLKPGLPVHLSMVHGQISDAIAGQIRLVANNVDPVSRLVDVYVSVPEQGRLLLDSFVSGRVVIETKTGLAAPRSAVLPEEDHYSIFTLRGNHAVKHTVRLGLQDDQTVEILGEDLKAGEPVVVEGNYELEDGMEVERQP